MNEVASSESLEARIAREQQALEDVQKEKRRFELEQQQRVAEAVGRLKEVVTELIKGLPSEIVRIAPSEKRLSFKVELGDFRKPLDGQKFSERRFSSEFAQLAVNKDSPREDWHLTSSFSRGFFLRNEESDWERAHAEFEKAILAKDLIEAKAWFEERIIQGVALVKMYQAKNPIVEIEEDSAPQALPSSQKVQETPSDLIGRGLGAILAGLGRLVLGALVICLVVFVVVVAFRVAAKFFGWVFS